MKPYDALTLRGQARRLRRLAFAALEQYELDKRMRKLMNS